MSRVRMLRDEELEAYGDIIEPSKKIILLINL